MGFFDKLFGGRSDETLTESIVPAEQKMPAKRVFVGNQEITDPAKAEMYQAIMKGMNAIDNMPPNTTEVVVDGEKITDPDKIARIEAEIKNGASTMEAVSKVLGPPSGGSHKISINRSYSGPITAEMRAEMEQRMKEFGTGDTSFCETKTTTLNAGSGDLEKLFDELKKK